MDRTGDTVELLIEHATDFRMCDLLDEASPSNPGAAGGIGANVRKMIDDNTTVGLAPGMCCCCCCFISNLFVSN